MSSEYSSSVPAGSVIGENPAAGTQVSLGSPVKSADFSRCRRHRLRQIRLRFENNYFVTGDYASAGVTLRGTGTGGMATGTITIPSSASAGQGVPDGADIIDAFLYWETMESTPTPSANSGTFLGYSDHRDSRSEATCPTPTRRPFDRDAARLSRRREYLFPGGRERDPLRLGQLHGLSAGWTEPHCRSPRARAWWSSIACCLPNFPLKSVVIYDGSAIADGF